MGGQKLIEKCGTRARRDGKRPFPRSAANPAVASQPPGPSGPRYHYLLAQGTTGLSVAFDLLTQMGYDSLADLADDEVGKVGVAIDTVEDMKVLFDQIPLGEVSTSMTINAPASLLPLMYQIADEEQAVAPEKLRGTIQNDVLRGVYGGYIPHDTF